MLGILARNMFAGKDNTSKHMGNATGDETAGGWQSCNYGTRNSAYSELADRSHR